MNNIQVYKHISLKNNSVFYIGIGKPGRSNSINNRNQHWKNIVKKYGYKIEIIHENLSWKKACEIEKNLILKYGRIDTKTGSLVNMTDGGEGINNPSNKLREMLGPKKGSKQSQAHIQKLSKIRKGKKRSEKTKLKIKNSMSKKKVFQYNLDGSFVKEWISAAEAGRNGFNGSHVAQCARKSKGFNSHKNYLWKYH